jgi:seryl-tRNA synthetase
MLDIKRILDDPEAIKKSSAAKGVTLEMNALLETIDTVKKIRQKIQQLNEERNLAAKERNREKGKALKESFEKESSALLKSEETLQALLLQIPNPAKPDVKVGKDESENDVISTYKTPTKFSFTPRDHMELGELLDIIDVKTAAKVSGSRFGYLKNEGVLLEFALKQLAFDTLIPQGFIPVLPPVLIKKEIMEGLGYTALGEAENIFSLDKDDLFLVGTAEQSIVPMHKDEVLKKEELPKRYVGFSTSFRREAGSYGKDTKGIFRVHQFDKVEMVSFVAEGDDDREHEFLLSIEEKFFQMLEIPYQVVRICTGDLGFNAARKYDIEAWIPSQERYREITSTSTVTDFQSRRLNMKYQEGNEKKYLHVLNGTAFSMNRPIIAILENYQQEDGSVVVPEVLRKYIGKDVIKSRKK